MKPFLTVLFALMVPLAAQSDATKLRKVYDDAAGAAEAGDAQRSPLAGIPAPTLGFEVRADGAMLEMLVASPTFDPDGVKIIVANCVGTHVTIPGFPPLLVPHVVICVSPLVEGEAHQIPFTGLPYDLYLQAGALVNGKILVSETRVVKSWLDS